MQNPTAVSICFSGLLGSGHIWNRVWRKRHRGIVLWQLRWDYGSSAVGSTWVRPEAHSVCSWTEAVAVSNHEHGSKGGGDFTAGTGRYAAACRHRGVSQVSWCLTTSFPLVTACTGITLPSLTSAIYFAAFLGLIWWWLFSRSISLLIFSSLCVMMAIFSGGHLLALYLYQLPLSQEIVPPEDVYARWSSDIEVNFNWHFQRLRPQQRETRYTLLF